MARTAGWFAAYLLFALATHTHALHQTMQCDLSLFTRYGQDWADGAKPYHDRYEPKTPVVFAAFRAVGWRNPPVALYLATAGLIAVAASELRRTALGPAAGLILIGFSSTLPYVHMYGAFVVPLMTLAVAWAERRPWAAGAAFALAVGLFPPAGLGGFAVLPFWRRRAAGWFVLGAAAVGGLIAAHAVAGGYWDGLLDAMAANRRYAAVSRVTPRQHVQRWWQEARTLAGNLGPAGLIALVVGLLASMARWRQVSAAGRRWAVAGGLWLVAAEAGAFAGGRHFTHYYFPVVAPLAVLTAVGVSALPPTARRLGLAVFVVAGLGTNWFVHIPELRAARRLDPNHERTAVVIAAAYLNTHTRPDEPVLVATWNRWAELYWRVRRLSPSRHVVPFNLAETRPELFAEWAEDALARPPEWIVTDDSTFGPGVTDEVLRGRASGFGGPALVGTPAFERLPGGRPPRVYCSRHRRRPHPPPPEPPVTATLLCLLVAQAPAPTFPDAAHAGGSMRHVQAVPVVTVAGTPEQMGEQFGVLAIKNAPALDKLFDDFLTDAGIKSKKFAVLAAQRLVPGTAPRLRAEIEAAAKASGRDPGLGFFANSVYDLSTGMGCSTVVVEPGRSLTGGPVFGRNFDYQPTAGIMDHTLLAAFKPAGRRGVRDRHDDPHCRAASAG